MKIIDCFIFYNEIEMLIYRLNILDNVCDYFVIIESTHTFVGKEKPLYFNENKHLFEKFNKKIIHIIVDDFPNKYPNITSHSQVWENEYFQRNCIARGLACITNLSDNDIISISDLDEILDPNMLDKIKKELPFVEGNTINNYEIYIPLMDLYYYSLNHLMKMKWWGVKILSYKKYKELNMPCNTIRFLNGQIIIKGGWHLSYFGDKYFIQNKIQNFSHQELNSPYFTDLEKIEERVKNGKDLYERNEHTPEFIKIEDNNYLPVEYNKYLNKYYKITDLKL